MAKSRDAFRTISEVSTVLDTPTHVLRFWESKFTQIKPVKRAGGRRYYRPEDISLLAGIKVLLHDQGMTIKGAQKLLRESGVKHVMALGNAQDDAAQETTASMPIVDAAKIETQMPPTEATAPLLRDEPTPQPAPASAAAPVSPQTVRPALLPAITKIDKYSIRQKSRQITPFLMRLEMLRDRIRAA